MGQKLDLEQSGKTDAAREMCAEDAAAPDKFFTTPLAIIFFTVFIDLVGFGIVIPILPYYVEHFGGTAQDVGWLTASYSLMQFVFAPILGHLSDRYGRRPILFISILGSSLGFLIVGMANVLWLVFLGRILAGITGGNISTAQAYIADVTSPANRAKGMGLMGAAFGLGFIFGPALGGVLSQFGSSVPFYFVAALSLVNAISLYFILPETVKPGRIVEKTRGRFASLFQAFENNNMAFVILIYFLLNTAFAIMTTAFALYTQFSFGYTETHTGYLFTYIGFLTVILQGAFHFFAKRFGERPLVVFGTFVMAGALFVVPSVSPTSGGLLALLAGLAAFSIGQSVSNPSLTTLGSRYSSDEEQGAGLGVLQSSASLARTIGPGLAAVLMNSTVATNAIRLDWNSLYRTFWTASGIMFAAFLLSLYFFKNGRSHETVVRA